MSKFVLAGASKLQKPSFLAKLRPNLQSTNRNFHRENILFRSRQNINFVRHSSTNIITSPFSPIEIPNTDLVSYIWKDTEKWDDETVVTCAASGRNYSYGMMKMVIDRCAQALIGHCKLQPGEVVGLLLPNLPEFIIVSHGILAAGLVATSVNPLYKHDEVKHQFQNANVKAIVTIQLFLDSVLKMVPELPGYRTTICVGGEDDKVNNVQGLQTLLMAGHTAELPKINPDDIALLPYSSGTTGLPKGVQLSHRNLVSNLAQGNNDNIWKIFPEEQFQKSLTVLPMFHIYGFNSIMNCSVMLGIHLVTLPRFVPEDYIKALVEHRPYALFVVPSLLLFLATHPAVTKDHLSSIETITSGAALATEGLLQKFREKVDRDILIRQGYGMTESSPVITYCPRNTPASKKETVGVLLPNTEAKVVSLTTGKTLGPHKPGELYARGPQVMQGYLNNKKATDETLVGDGWIRTGDVVHYDEDGYFFIVDRCKELIKVKGNQVSPTELENLILELPDVADVAVVGIPDILAGEIPRAFVVRKENSKLNEQDVIEYITPKVASYKKLAGGIQFINAIPRNPSGKILRNQLKVLNV